MSPIDPNRLNTQLNQTGDNQPIQWCNNRDTHQQSSDYWLSFNQTLHFSNTHSDIITVESKLNGNSAIALIDTGASGNFISKDYLNKGSSENVVKLRRFITSVNEKKVKLADGSIIKTNQILSNVPLQVNGKTINTSFGILSKLNKKYDLILAMPYLSEANPDISCRNKTISWRINCQCGNVIQKICDKSKQPLRGPNINVISNAEVEELKRRTLKRNVNNVRSYRNKSIGKPNYSKKGLLNQDFKPNEIEESRKSLHNKAKLTQLRKNPINQLSSVILKAMDPTVQLEEIDELFICHIRDTSLDTATKDDGDGGSDTESFSSHHKDAKKIIREFKSIFPDELPKKLPPKRALDHKIDLVDGAKPPNLPIYRMSDYELKELKKQLDNLLACGFIRPSVSEFGSPCLFVKKKDGTMRLVVDYRKLNDITIKNSFGLPRADEQIESVRGMKWFTKPDLHSGYNQLRVVDADQHKTAFKCRFGHYEFTVTPFGLCNAPSSFQAMMNTVLYPVLGTKVLCYLDDVLIYSPTLKQHVEDVREVLELLRKNELFVKLKKCEFFRNKVSFLGHRVSGDGISVEEDKIKAIQQWPTPKTVRQIQSFLGAASYYRKFVPKFSQIAAPLIELLKRDTPWNWTGSQQSAFDRLKHALTNAPVLKQPDYTKPFLIISDASQHGIGGVLVQLDDEGFERPIAYFSRKFQNRQYNWSTYEQELYALVESLKHFRPYVEGKKVTLYTDHRALIHLNKQAKLTGKQARWIGFINLFDYEIRYREGKINAVADGLSRQYAAGEHQKPQDERLRINVDEIEKQCASVFMTGESELLQRIRKTQSQDEQCVRVLRGTQNGTDKTIGFKVRNGIVLVNGRYFIPLKKELRIELLIINHDNQSHIGVQKSYELLSRSFYWKNMFNDVQDYIRQCVKCQRSKPINQLPHGLLQPLKIPDDRWQSVAIDFITGLPKSNGFDAIMTVTDRLTKMVHILPCHKNATAIDIAKLFIKHVVRHHGIAQSIVSDRDPKFVSNFWQSISKALKIN